MEEFKIGDIVYITGHNDVKMTVAEIQKSWVNGVKCVWFDKNNDLKEMWLNCNILERVIPPYVY